jgi:hypothetical protein
LKIFVYEADQSCWDPVVIGLTGGHPPPLNSPSVTSVTSVRCFPRIALMLAQKPRRSPKAIRHFPEFPLCDLCIPLYTSVLVPVT